MSSTATLTELLRTPKDVIARTDDGVVRITRRDASDLVMLRASDLEHQQEGIGLSSRLMRATFRSGGDLRAAIGDLFAWASLLSETELTEFTADMEKLLWSATELGHYDSLLRAFGQWQATAEAYAAGMPRGRGEDLTWLEAPADVDAP